MSPCLVARVAFLPAEAMPHLRSSTSASVISPLASTRAFLHSIMPAPVRSRRSFTSDAVTSAIFPSSQSLAGRCCEQVLLVSALCDGGFRRRLRYFRVGAFPLLRDRLGFLFHTQALGHDLVQDLRIHV